MAQAKAMQQSSRGTPLTTSDIQLGLRGLNEADQLRNKGDLSGALKLYELSLELLLKFLKEKENLGVDRKTVQERVMTALEDAERVKERISRLKGTIPNAQQSPTARQLQSTLRAKKPSTTVPRSSASSAEGRDQFTRSVEEEMLVDPSTFPEVEIAGLEDVRQSLEESAVLPLLRPDLFTGLRRPQNVLLYGPPGTGKTLLVKSVARHSSLLVCSASSLTSKWMGEAEKMVRAVFQVARQRAPSIIFVDELDALLSTRSSSNEHESSRRLKTEFMVQMDGIRGAADNVLVLGCTNCPWDIDAAVLRRFPRRIYVPLPDRAARVALLENLFRKAGQHKLGPRDLQRLADQMDGLSCSDIQAIASEASYAPLRSLGSFEAVCRAKELRPITRADVEQVLRTSTKSVSAEHVRKFVEWQQSVR